jgi:hypothetical protein
LVFSLENSFDAITTTLEEDYVMTQKNLTLGALSISFVVLFSNAAPISAAHGGWHLGEYRPQFYFRTTDVTGAGEKFHLNIAARPLPPEHAAAIDERSTVLSLNVRGPDGTLLTDPEDPPQLAICPGCLRTFSISQVCPPGSVCELSVEGDGIEWKLTSLEPTVDNRIAGTIELACKGFCAGLSAQTFVIGPDGGTQAIGDYIDSITMLPGPTPPPPPPPAEN